jgi:hypothetical protein
MTPCPASDGTAFRSSAVFAARHAEPRSRTRIIGDSCLRFPFSIRTHRPDQGSLMNNQERQQRRYVAQMAERLRRGLMDRRDFIRAAGMAGFGFANARDLGGGGASSVVAQEAAATVQVADEATGSTAAQQAFLKEEGGRLRGTRISSSPRTRRRESSSATASMLRAMTRRGSS